METTEGSAAQVQSASSKLEAHLGYWLRRVSNPVSAAFARALQTRHTSVAEWVVMCHLEESPGMTPAALAERLGLTRGAVSKVIDKLEEKRWVAHSTKREDGRVRMLTLTRQGSHVLPELSEIADQNDREFFEGLDTEEKAALRCLLEKLVAIHQIRNEPIE